MVFVCVFLATLYIGSPMLSLTSPKTICSDAIYWNTMAWLRKKQSFISHYKEINLTCCDFNISGPNIRQDTKITTLKVSGFLLISNPRIKCSTIDATMVVLNIYEFYKH